MQHLPTVYSILLQRIKMKFHLENFSFMVTDESFRPETGKVLPRTHKSILEVIVTCS